MIVEQNRTSVESLITPSLVADVLESLVNKGDFFGVLEIHIERKIVRVKNRQTFLKADLEDLIRR